MMDDELMRRACVDAVINSSTPMLNTVLIAHADHGHRTTHTAPRTPMTVTARRSAA
jgi:hypothetical protein